MLTKGKDHRLRIGSPRNIVVAHGGIMTEIYRFVCTAILLAAFAFSCPAWASYVTAEGVNCRSRPDVGERVVAKLSKGKSVLVSEAGGGWSKLEAAGRSWRGLPAGSVPGSLRLIMSVRFDPTHTPRAGRIRQDLLASQPQGHTPSPQAPRSRGRSPPPRGGAVEVEAMADRPAAPAAVEPSA